VCSACCCDGCWDLGGSALLVTIAHRPGRIAVTSPRYAEKYGLTYFGVLETSMTEFRDR
jgi:hypothetical protein